MLTTETKPVRLRRTRTSYPQSPNGLPVKYVGRPTKYGNPFTVAQFGQNGAVDAFIAYMESPVSATLRTDAKKELRGCNLVCWCKPNERCHADVLLEIANAEAADAS